MLHRDCTPQQYAICSLRAGTPRPGQGYTITNEKGAMYIRARTVMGAFFAVVLYAHRVCAVCMCYTVTGGGGTDAEARADAGHCTRGVGYATHEMRGKRHNNERPTTLNQASPTGSSRGPHACCRTPATTPCRTRAACLPPALRRAAWRALLAFYTDGGERRTPSVMCGPIYTRHVVCVGHVTGLETLSGVRR